MENVELLMNNKLFRFFFICGVTMSVEVYCVRRVIGDVALIVITVIVVFVNTK